MAFSSLLLLVLALIVHCRLAAKTKVVVTGAGGRLGSIVFKKLLTSPNHQPVGIVRTSESKDKLLRRVGENIGDRIVISDVANPEQLVTAFQGADSVILCTSATPKIKIFSLIKVLFLKIFGQNARPEFTFSEKGTPYFVDWLGGKNQIDAAKAAGVKHFIFVSSMGGTQPDHFLNTIGRVEGDEKSGNVLVWKRKAESYLIQSGLPYTIIHPGHLTEEQGGQSQLVMDFDDRLLQREVRTISREDVAEVCIQALTCEDARNKSFDVIADKQSRHQRDWLAFFAQPGHCQY